MLTYGWVPKSKRSESFLYVQYLRGTPILILKSSGSKTIAKAMAREWKEPLLPPSPPA
jgi:hypothetical protein